VAWGDSGGGYSVYFNEPYYQLNARITDPQDKRGVPDVAFDADPIDFCINNGSFSYSVL
jgi:subtilase family serine protease